MPPKQKSPLTAKQSQIATLNNKTFQLIANLRYQINITPRDGTLTKEDLINNSIGLRALLIEAQNKIDTYGLDLLTRISNLEKTYSSFNEAKEALKEDADAKGKSLYHQITDPEDASPRSIEGDISHLLGILRLLTNSTTASLLQKSSYANIIIGSLIELGVEPALILSCPNALYYMNYNQISQLADSLTEYSLSTLASRTAIPSVIINAILRQNHTQITQMISTQTDNRIDILRMMIDLGIIFEDSRVVGQALAQYIINYIEYPNEELYQVLLENAASAFIRGNLEICSLFTTLETWSLLDLYEQDQLLHTIIYRSGITVSKELVKSLYHNGFIHAQLYIDLIDSTGSKVESESDAKRELIVKAFESISNEIMLELLQVKYNPTAMAGNLIGLSLLFKQLTEEKQKDFIRKNYYDIKLLMNQIDTTNIRSAPGLSPLLSLVDKLKEEEIEIEKQKVIEEAKLIEKQRLIAEQLIQEEAKEKDKKEKAKEKAKANAERQRKESEAARAAKLAKEKQKKEDEIVKKKAEKEQLLESLANIEVEEKITERNPIGWNTATKVKPRAPAQKVTTYREKSGGSHNGQPQGKKYETSKEGVTKHTPKQKKVEPHKVVPKGAYLSALEGKNTEQNEEQAPPPSPVKAPVDISKIGHPEPKKTQAKNNKPSDLPPVAVLKQDPTSNQKTSGDDNDDAPQGEGNAAIIPNKSAEIPTVAAVDTASTEALKLQLEIEKLKLAQIEEQRKLEELKKQEPTKPAVKEGVDQNDGAAYAQHPQQQYYNGGAAYSQHPQQYYSYGHLSYDQNMGLYFDPSINLHYDRTKGLHYDSLQGLYYDANTGEYYHPSTLSYNQQQSQRAHSSGTSNKGTKGSKKGTTKGTTKQNSDGGDKKGNQYADFSSQQKINTSDFKDSTPKELDLTIKTVLAKKEIENEEHKEYRESNERIKKFLESLYIVQIQNDNSTAPEKLPVEQKWIELPFHFISEPLFIGDDSGLDPFEAAVNNQVMRAF